MDAFVIIYVIQESVKMYNVGFRIKEEEDAGEEQIAIACLFMLNVRRIWEK